MKRLWVLAAIIVILMAVIFADAMDGSCSTFICVCLAAAFYFAAEAVYALNRLSDVFISYAKYRQLKRSAPNRWEPDVSGRSDLRYRKEDGSYISVSMRTWIEHVIFGICDITALVIKTAHRSGEKRMENSEIARSCWNRDLAGGKEAR